MCVYDWKHIRPGNQDYRRDQATAQKVTNETELIIVKNDDHHEVNLKMLLKKKRVEFEGKRF